MIDTRNTKSRTVAPLRASGSIAIACIVMSTSAVAQNASGPSSSGGSWQGKWEGTYDTDYGTIRLNQADKYVFGDYGSTGTIQGIVDENRRTLRGLFKRKDDGSIGHIEWHLTSATRFQGRWNWQTRAFPSWNGSTGAGWSGRRVSGRKPELVTYKGTTNIGTFFGRRSQRFVNWARSLYPAPIQKVEHGLDFAPRLTPAKLKTAFEMQRHIQAISKSGDFSSSNGELPARRAFEAMDYDLLGKGIINERGPTSNLRAAVARKGDAVVVSFRGTSGDTWRETFDNAVMIDAIAAPVPPFFMQRDARQGVRVHAGFHTAYSLLRAQVLDALPDERGLNLFITGHSLGGALAQLMALDIAANKKSDFASLTVITSGSPRVGNAGFKSAFERLVPDNLRVIVNHDPVPSVPWVEGLYRQAGKSLVIGRDDAVLVRHGDQDVEVNIDQFVFHSNDAYYRAVQMLARRAPHVARLTPNGETWARDATTNWYNRTLDQRNKSAARRVGEKAVGAVKRGFNRLKKN